MSERGVDWAPETADHQWDGHVDGLDFDAWCYATVDGGWRVVVRQMPPNLVLRLAGADAGDPVTFTIVWADGEADYAGGVEVGPDDVRVPFELLPDSIAGDVWFHAADGWIVGDDELVYGNGRWAVKVDG
jgi:hypothetical protein